MASNVTFNLSQEQATRVKALHDPESETITELVARIVNQGLYQMEYRKKAYPKRKEQMKDMRKVYRMARENPDLAEQLGLGTRS